MLNISKNRIDGDFKEESFKSLDSTKKIIDNNILYRMLFIGLVLLIIAGLLPWTQNITAKGKVTALNPEERPQTIHSIIPGRIEKWMVAEGDFVKRGDTLVLISEIKDDYLDPNLVRNIEQQIMAKELGVKSYMDKVNALDSQIDALIKNQILKKEQGLNKIEQSRLKVFSDSTDLIAEKINLQVAQNQLERAEELYEEGLKSLTDVEEKRLKYQESLAKKIAQENKLLTTRNEYINAQVDYNNIKNEFADKIAKSESEKYASLSNMYDSETQVSKLQNQFANYEIRSGMYYIISPQDAYITKAFVTGIGENIKEGEPLMSIMPSNASLAVEMFVRPMDLPLLMKGQKVRLEFDGWPALVFSGWQGVSFGTFGGKIVAIDNFTTDEKHFRVLVSPDEESEDWPSAIKIGAGASTITLLNNVPIWYEIWRQINGFPPNYYEGPAAQKNEKEAKK